MRWGWAGLHLLAAATVVARMALPPGEITVGDPVLLKLTLTHPPGAVLDYPNAASLAPPAEGLGEGGGSEAGGDAAGRQPAPPKYLVEEIQALETKPPIPGETSWSIRVRPFVTGDVTIPALAVSYRLPGASAPQTVSTEAVTFHVKSVLKGPDDQAADIKGPWWLPRALLPWILGALALAVLLALVVRWWRRRKPKPPQAAPAPVAQQPPAELPYARAMRELKALIAAGLPGPSGAARSVDLKGFHVQLSEIVKRFLGGHHGFDALDRTTLEVLVDMQRLGIDPAVRERTGRFLEGCDLVKFAKHRPDLAGIEASVDAARALIETGRPRPAQAASAGHGTHNNDDKKGVAA